MTIDADTLLFRRNGRLIALEELEVVYAVRALVQFNIDPEVARVFAFSHADRGAVIRLAQRKGLVSR